MLFAAFHRAIGAGEKRPSSHSRSRLWGTSPFLRGGCVSPDAIVLVLARSRRPVRHVGRLSIAVLRRFRLSCDRKQLGIAAWLLACRPAITWPGWPPLARRNTRIQTCPTRSSVNSYASPTRRTLKRHPAYRIVVPSGTSGGIGTMREWTGMRIGRSSIVRSRSSSRYGVCSPQRGQ